MYNGFYSDPYSREDIDGDEIYVKNDQIYDNETRSTVPTKKDSAPYDDLPVTLQNPINATCRCNTIQSGGLNNEIIKDTNSGILSKMLKFGNSSTNPILSESSESSKFSLNISLTITEIIQILVLIMIVVLIAITIRTRSRILVFTQDKTQSNNLNPTSAV